VDSVGRREGLLAVCCKCGDEPSGSGAKELVNIWRRVNFRVLLIMQFSRLLTRRHS
jgi:hypothetical protein